MTVIDECPNRAELDRAAMTGKAEGIDWFFGRADVPSEDRMSGGKAHAALDDLARYIDAAWIESRRADDRRRPVKRGRPRRNTPSVTDAGAMPGISDYAPFDV